VSVLNLPGQATPAWAGDWPAVAITPIDPYGLADLGDGLIVAVVLDDNDSETSELAPGQALSARSPA
jgi:hypothetical protein